MTDPITRLNAALEGRYRIEREIGEGGMATVYLAEDLRHERKVALKVLKPELAAVVGAERFLAEIKTTANLQHPHILPLHDSGEADGFLFFVTPYIEGDTLRDKIDREKQLSIEDALDISKKVASALDYAHKQAVVHRDIKPGNILLSADGEPTVADFGIALAVAHAGGGRVTETGLSVGTPHYMSPEQATGDRDVDPRTDVYALGSVLYEMLTGDPPYQGSTAQAVLAKILTDPAPAPTKVRLSIPPNVDAAIRKALEKLPADRFGTAQDFSEALGDAGFRHGEEAAGVAASAGPWKAATVALGALAILATAFGAWSLLRPEPPPTPVSRQVLSTQGWAGLEGPAFGRYAAIAPDGSSMILPVGSQFALKMSGSTEITPIPGTEGGHEVVYRPDGQWIAYVVGSDLFKRPLIGGGPVRLAEDADGTVVGLAWLDDGTILYERDGGDPRTIARIPEEGGEPLVVLEVPAPLWLHGLPDAQGALMIACPGASTCSLERANLYVVDLRDLSSNLILERVARAWYTPTGHIVYVGPDGALFAVPFDLGGLAVTGSAIPLFDGVRVTLAWADMRLGADGTLLYVEGSSAGVTAAVQRLLVVDLEGNEEALPLDPRAIPRVSWSPDGQSVAYSLNVPPGQPHDLNTYNVTLGTTPRQLTFEGSNEWGVFSPDGTRIAFSSGRAGTELYDLFVKNLDDDTLARSLITLPGTQRPTQWPSDTLIVFESGSAGPSDRDLWMLNLSDPDNPGAEAYLSSEAGLGSIKVSRDGTLAAYDSDESGANEVYIRSFPDPGERTPVSQGGGVAPSWSPDGNTVYYWRIESPVVLTLMAARIQRQPTPVVLSRDSLFTREVVATNGGSVVAYDLHPDGDRLIVARNAPTAPGADGDASPPDRLILVNNFFEELRQVVPDP